MCNAHKTKYFLATPTGVFGHRETIYSGASLATANLTAVVEHYDSANLEICVNNIINDGTVNVANTFSIVGNTTGATATVIAIDVPELKQYTGDLLYVQNSSVITRDPTEHQQFKIVLRF